MGTCGDALLLNHGEQKWLWGCLMGHLGTGRFCREWAGDPACLPAAGGTGEMSPRWRLLLSLAAFGEGHRGDRSGCGDLL